MYETDSEGSSRHEGHTAAGLDKLDSGGPFLPSLCAASDSHFRHAWMPLFVVNGRPAVTVQAFSECADVLRNTRQRDFHIFVADVVKTVDTVYRDILDCAFRRLGLRACFRRVYFSFNMEKSGHGLSKPRGQASPGQETAAFLVT